MDVFLVPVAADRHELYCEVPDEPHDPADDDVPRGFFGRNAHRLKHRFKVMLAEAEHERRHGRAERRHGWLSRLRGRTMRWVAEAIAEQRLLWHLRKQSSVTLFYPDDTTEAAVLQDLRRQLSADFEKHRFWLILDALAFIASGLLFFVPGPNIVAYYFAFRIVGHYLSMRGARQGLDVVSWVAEPSATLTALRAAIALEPEPRAERLEQLAAELRLEHLARFLDRMATV